MLSDKSKLTPDMRSIKYTTRNIPPDRIVDSECSLLDPPKSAAKPLEVASNPILKSINVNSREIPTYNFN